MLNVVFEPAGNANNAKAQLQKNVDFCPLKRLNQQFHGKESIWT